MSQATCRRSGSSRCKTALELAAEAPGAHRTLARARTQLASVQSLRGKSAEALKTLEPVFVFLKDHKYRNLELTALSIAARAYQDLDDIPKARDIASQALKEAEATGDESRLSLALSNLASQAAVLGSLPEALALRERAEAIHRRQGNTLLLPFDLTNRAELLIRLGRFDEASTALTEVDAGAEKKLDAYVSRRQRVVFLRTLSEILSNRLTQAANMLKTMPKDPPDSPAAALAPALASYIQAKQTTASRPVPESAAPKTEPAVLRERQYWTAAAALERGDARTAIEAASAGIEQASKIGNDELTWRIAAVGTIAARRLGNREQLRVLKETAVAARSRLHASWGSSIGRYEQRPDLIELRKASELED